RTEHMRLTAIVSRMSPKWREYADILAVAIPAVFLAIILPYALSYAEDEWFIETPALGWSNIVHAAAIPVGCAIMLLGSMLRLLRYRLMSVLAVLAGLAFVTLGLYFATPALKAIGNWNLAFFFLAFLAACVLLGVPIGFAFGTATVAFLICVTRPPLTIVVSRMDEGMSSLVLLAVPLFVFLGLLIEMTGMARAMVAFLAGLLGHVRGGLYYVLLGAMYLVSGISGSKAADMAAVAPVLFPEMRQRGSNDGEMVSILAASGAMSETIPPSLVLITIGSVTGVSIAGLFTGGLLPALVAELALVVVCRLRSRGENLVDVRRAPLREIGRTFVVALPALALPFLIRSAVIEGIATATEVSTVGVVDTASLSGAILLIIGMATAMAWALTQSGFSRQLVTMMEHVPGGQLGFLAVTIVVFAILGSVLEGIPAIVLFGPLLFPAARALGVHDVHYAMVVILAMGIGLFAPPFGVGFYAACAIGRVSPDDAMGRVWPYLGAVLIALIVVALIPWLSIGFL